MKSSHRRVSRALVFGVGAVITLGVVFWLGKLSATTSKATMPKEQPARAAAPTDPGMPKVEAKLASVAGGQSAVAVAATQPAATVLFAASAQLSTTQPAQAAAGGATRLASSSIAPSGSPLADAKAKIDTGRPLEARKILNTALVSNSFS